MAVYSQKVVCVACLGKKWFFIRNFANFANCELLRILIKFFFIGSRSCPNQTKLGIENHQCNERVKQKICWYSLPRKKMVFHMEFCEFRELRIFENFRIFFSSGQGAVQIKPNSVLSITSVIRVYSKNKFGRACLGKSWVFIRNFANFANCEFLRIL